MRSTFLRWMFWSQGAQGCTGEATFCLGIYVWRSFTPAMDDNYGLMVTNGNDHAKPFQYWNALKEIKSSEQDEDHSDHGPHSDNILHNHNVGHSNDDFWRHSNDAGNDFWCNKIKKKQQSFLPSVRSAMSALPLKGAQSLEHRITYIYIYYISESKTKTHRRNISEEQTNQGIKGLQYHQYLGKYRTKPIFLAPQDHLQWSEKSDVRCPTSNEAPVEHFKVLW